MIRELTCGVCKIKGRRVTFELRYDEVIKSSLKSWHGFSLPRAYL